MSSDLTKATLRLKGMDCVACSIEIDGSLEDIKGVKSANTDYAKSQVRVEFDPALLTIKRIIETIRGVGYDVEDV